MTAPVIAIIGRLLVPYALKLAGLFAIIGAVAEALLGDRADAGGLSRDAGAGDGVSAILLGRRRNRRSLNKRDCTTAFITGGHTPFPRSLIRSRLVPNGRT